MRKPRHLSSKKKETWTDLRAEIAHLCQKLRVSNEEFSEVGIHEWKDIHTKIWSKFSTPPEPFSIWDSLMLPHTSIVIDFSKLYFQDFLSSEEDVWYHGYHGQEHQSHPLDVQTTTDFGDNNFIQIETSTERIRYRFYGNNAGDAQHINKWSDFYSKHSVVMKSAHHLSAPLFIRRIFDEPLS